MDEGTYTFTVSGTGVADVSIPSVSVSNFLNNGVVHSGFITGTAVDDVSVASVEVQIDGGAYMAATGGANWSYKLPTGSDTWKPGSQHTINVRSRDNLGNYSLVTNLTVRKGVNKDVNGDGYADMATGASGYDPGSDPYTGRAYVFHSAGSGGVTVADAGNASTVITGEEEDSFFGLLCGFGGCK